MSSLVNHRGSPRPRRAAISRPARAIVPVLCLALLAGHAQAQGNPQPEFVSAAGRSTAPFSPAVKIGNLIFLSGEVGTGADGQLAPGGIGPETRQALTNIKAVVERAGSDMEHVVKCTAFLADMKEWGAMNDAYRTFFTEGRYPARSAFGTTGIARNGRVEIECIAAAK
jgi:2-iminobutanoate/2-iminopropanoate deaminase